MEMSVLDGAGKDQRTGVNVHRLETVEEDGQPGELSTLTLA